MPCSAVLLASPAACQRGPALPPLQVDSVSAVVLGVGYSITAILIFSESAPAARMLLPFMSWCFNFNLFKPMGCPCVQRFKADTSSSSLSDGGSPSVPKLHS